MPNKVHDYVKSRQYPGGTHPRNIQDLIGELIKARNLFGIQTVNYELMTVTSLDIDITNNFLLVGLSNGAVDLQEIDDPTFGNSTQLARFNFGQYNVNRVQWNPYRSEQFFTILDNNVLYLVDPLEMRAIDKFEFDMRTIWSEWHPMDPKIVAVAGTESQVRLVDVQSGNAAQTIILGAPSGLASHRATRCLWSKIDISCLIIGDNEGYVHVFDIRYSIRPLCLTGNDQGQVTGLSFGIDENSIVSTQGTENKLVEWNYDKCRLLYNLDKFRKRDEYPVEEVQASCSSNPTTGAGQFDPFQRKQPRKRKRTPPSLPVSAYIRCQMQVTDSLVLCPVPLSTKRSKEIYIYDLKSGYRIKTIRSDDILSQGVYSVISLLPESLVIYVGGRGRLRCWTFDEGAQRRLDARMRAYHRTRWESDDET